MNSNSFEYVAQYIRVNRSRVIIFALISLIMSIAIVRLMPVTFDARAHVIAKTSQNNSLLGAQALFPSVLSSLESDRFILMQEQLIKSRQIFDGIKTKTALSTKDNNTSFDLTFITDHMKGLLYGKNLLQQSIKYSDIDYENFVQNISFRPKLETGSFWITYSDRDPDQAVKILSHTLEELEGLNIRVNKSNLSKEKEFVETQMKRAEKDMRDSNEQIAEFLQRTGISTNKDFQTAKYKAYIDAKVELQKNTFIHQRALTQLRSAKLMLQDVEKDYEMAESQGSEAQLKMLQELRDSNVTVMANAAMQGESGDDLAINKLKNSTDQLTQLIESRFKTQNIKASATARESLFLSLQSSILELESQTNAIAKYISNLTSEVKDFENQIHRMPEAELELSKMMMESQKYIDAYRVLSERYLHLLLQSDVESSNLFVLESPQIDAKLFGGRAFRTLSTAVGIFVLLIAIFSLVNQIRGTIFSAKDLKRISSLPFIGSTKHRPKKAGKSLSGFTLTGIDSISSILEKKIIQRTQSSKFVVHLTSLRSGAGKSTTAIALAWHYAKRNKKSLIIDADFYADQQSISNILATNEGISVVNSTHAYPAIKSCADIPLTSLVTWNKITDSNNDYKEGLQLETLKNSIAKWRRDFDVIILDSGPAFFEETFHIAELADATLICCPEGQTTFDNVNDVVDKLNEYLTAEHQVYSIMTKCRLPENLGVFRNIDSSYTAGRYFRAS